ncbi:MAG: MFS transporter [Candidatus Omnitrophota bacterium]
MKKGTFFLLCLEGAILSFSVAASSALVPSIAKDFSVSEFFAARIIWLYFLPYGIAALLYGPLVRTFNAKKIELICLFSFSLSNLAAGLSRSINLLFIFRFFMGLFGASVIPLGLILISRHVEEKMRGRSVGFFFGFTFIGSLAGLFLSGIITWRYIYLIPGLSGLLLWVALYFYLPDFKEEAAALRFNYLSCFKNKTFFSIFTYIFLISFFYHGIQQWLGVYFSKSYQLNQFLISSLIILTGLSGILGEFFGGVLADKFGRVKTVNLGISLMIISAFALIFKLPLWVLGAIMFIWGLGWTFNHAGVSTLLTSLPEGCLNEAASLNSSLRFVSGGIGAHLSGLLMQRSFNLGFTALGAGLLVLLITGGLNGYQLKR